MNIFQKMIDQGSGEERQEIDRASKSEISLSQPMPAEIPDRHLDPRDDLTSDHELWVDILQNGLLWAELRDEKRLWGVLHGLRCGGARLERVKGEMGLRLVPGREDWRDDAEWSRIRKVYLDPVKDDLVRLFKFTKEHGRIPRMQELWPGAVGSQNGGSGAKKVEDKVEVKQGSIF